MAGDFRQLVIEKMRGRGRPPHVIDDNAEKRLYETLSNETNKVLRNIVDEIVQINKTINGPISTNITNISRLAAIEEELREIKEIDKDILATIEEHLVSTASKLRDTLPPKLVETNKNTSETVEKLDNVEKDNEEHTSKILSMFGKLGEKIAEHSEKAAFGLVSFLGNSPVAHAITQMSIKAAKGVAARIKEYRQNREIRKGQKTEIEILRDIDRNVSNKSSIDTQHAIETMRDSRTIGRLGRSVVAQRARGLGSGIMLAVGRFLAPLFRMLLRPITLLIGAATALGSGASFLVEVLKTAVSALAFLKNVLKKSAGGLLSKSVDLTKKAGSFVTKYGSKALRFVGKAALRSLPVVGAAVTGYEIGSFINDTLLTNDKGEGIIANAVFDKLHGDDIKEIERRRELIAKQKGFKSWHEFVEHNHRMARANVENKKRQQINNAVSELTENNQSVDASNATQNVNVLSNTTNNVNQQTYLSHTPVRNETPSIQKMMLGLAF